MFQIIKLEPKTPLKRKKKKKKIPIKSELQIFRHMIKPPVKFDSRDKILLVTSWTDVMTS